MANRTVMAKQLKCIVFTTLVIIVFMIAMPIFIMKPKVSANQVEEITNSNESVEASTKQNNNIIIKGNETVKVYITETGKIEEVNLEDYIYLNCFITFYYYIIILFCASLTDSFELVYFFHL